MRTLTLAAVTAAVFIVAGCLSNGGNLRVDRTGSGPPDETAAPAGAPATKNTTDATGTAQTGVGAVGKVIDAAGWTGFNVNQVMPWALSGLLGLFLVVNGFTVKRAVGTADAAVSGAFKLCDDMLRQSHERELARITMETERARATCAQASAVDSAVTTATVAVAANAPKT